MQTEYCQDLTVILFPLSNSQPIAFCTGYHRHTCSSRIYICF
nr:MAG TPA: hypothetical protein [Caudoviricetes sp.]